jgi:N-methylhydantoinase A
MSEVSSPTIRIGIDVGGTFTDLFLLDEANGRVVRHKLPSTPEQPHQAPIAGIREILALAGATHENVRFIGLGTTVATNAILERKGAKTGLITTAGFRDLLEIGRQKRPHVYDLFALKPRPLVPRDLRLEVDERVAADGSVVRELNESDVETALKVFRAAGVESIAVCCLNSYANPAHENRIRDLIHAGMPDATVTISNELLTEFREYERLSSTVINAYLMPVMKRYLDQFSDQVRGLGIAEPPFVMSSGGGVVSPGIAGDRPVDLLLSGPSGGVSGSIYQAGSAGYENLIAFDMGGTSTDICLIQNSKAEIAHSRSIGGLPIRSTMVDIHTIGAGGGSIAWIDAGGFLKVGPQSAGAKPGPACYGHAGAKPTVTDANVVLGRLNPEFLLAGALKIDASLSAKAIEDAIASRKNIPVQEAAAAILAVSNMNIAQAIRFVSVERGLDASEFMLVAFGGAGPVQAADVARELQMKVLVPPGPGVMCAMGVLTKDIQLDASRTRLTRSSLPAVEETVSGIYGDLETRVVDTFKGNRLPVDGLIIERTVDARYVGQNFELSVAVPPGRLAAAGIVEICKNFGAAHKRLYGYEHPGQEVEMVTFRVKAMLPVAKPALARAAPASAGRTPEPIGMRKTYFGTVDRFVDCPVFDRAALAAGMVITGPSIIEQMDTTTVIPPDFRCECDIWGNLILSQIDEGGEQT